MRKRLLPIVSTWMVLGCLAALGLSQHPPSPISELLNNRSVKMPYEALSRMERFWIGEGCTAWTTECGDLIEYIPSELADNPRLVILVHGSIPAQQVAMDAAATHITRARWRRFAEQKGYILVAPAFDRKRYGGYRYLEGNGVDADEFVLRIAETYAQIYDMPDSRFYLYGHSAGGQFAHRFLVTHPDRLLGAVISAPGNYANPTTSIIWPYGIQKSPNPLGFVQSARVPTAVVVGALDIKQFGMGGRYQFGSNRVQRAKKWVTAMRSLADGVGIEPRMELSVVPGVPHSSSGLLEMCTCEFDRIVEFREKLIRAGA